MQNALKKNTTLKFVSKSIVILIDCFENNFNSSVYDKLINNIINKITTITNLNAVVLASYGEEHLSSNLYYENSKTIFNNNDNLFDTSFINNLSNQNEHTHPLILNRTWSCKQYAMQLPEQLNHYITTYAPDVTSVYIFGWGWDKCVKGRPLGWLGIAEAIINNKLIELNILTDSNCVAEVTVDNVFSFRDLHNDVHCKHRNGSVFDIINTKQEYILSKMRIQYPNSEVIPAEISCSDAKKL